jgi:hypothetical protein
MLAAATWVLLGPLIMAVAFIAFLKAEERVPITGELNTQS